MIRRSFLKCSLLPLISAACSPRTPQGVPSRFVARLVSGDIVLNAEAIELEVRQNTAGWPHEWCVSRSKISGYEVAAEWEAVPYPPRLRYHSGNMWNPDLESHGSLALWGVPIESEEQLRPFLDRHRIESTATAQLELRGSTKPVRFSRCVVSSWQSSTNDQGALIAQLDLKVLGQIPLSHEIVESLDV